MAESGHYDIDSTTVRPMSRQQAPSADFMNREIAGEAVAISMMIVRAPLLVTRANDAANPALSLSDRHRSRGVLEPIDNRQARPSRPVALQGAELSNLPA
jgi:hypothetical protein